MKIRKLLLSICLLAISTVTHSLEITPLLGYRGGGEFIDTTNNTKHTIESSDVYGLIIGWPYEQGKDIEIYYSHQSSQLNSVDISDPATPTTNNVDLPLTIDYLHIGGTVPITDEKKYKTFMSGGLGFTYLSPDFEDLQSDLRASFSIGVGVKWLMTDNIALRLETRGLATLFNSNTAIFCNGGCSLSVNGSLFFQGEVSAGLAIRF
jgi:opacity protein-like surface antigen